MKFLSSKMEPRELKAQINKSSFGGIQHHENQREPVTDGIIAAQGYAMLSRASLGHLLHASVMSSMVQNVFACE
jgi:hypothetical protein